MEGEGGRPGAISKRMHPPTHPHAHPHTHVTTLPQGYGLTETCAASFIMLPDPRMAYTVGPPLSATEFRLESVPELKYEATGQPPAVSTRADCFAWFFLSFFLSVFLSFFTCFFVYAARLPLHPPPSLTTSPPPPPPPLPRTQGEVCIRGPLVFAGYFKDPERTKAEFDADGFFHSGELRCCACVCCETLCSPAGGVRRGGGGQRCGTPARHPPTPHPRRPAGDIATVTPQGCLKIVDRKKNIFKMAQGKRGCLWVWGGCCAWRGRCGERGRARPPARPPPPTAPSHSTQASTLLWSTSRTATAPRTRWSR